MLIYLLRHGLTQDNQEKRYQGRRDVPLCPQGLAQLRRADFAPKTVMITSLPVSYTHLRAHDYFLAAHPADGGSAFPR